jgi:hypothetical protein
MGTLQHRDDIFASEIAAINEMIEQRNKHSGAGKAGAC